MTLLKKIQHPAILRIVFFLKSETIYLRTNGRSAECNSQGREVWKCWEADQCIISFGVFMGFVEKIVLLHVQLPLRPLWLFVCWLNAMVRFETIICGDVILNYIVMEFLIFCSPLLHLCRSNSFVPLHIIMQSNSTTSQTKNSKKILMIGTSLTQGQ